MTTTVARIAEIAEARGFQFQWAEGYADPLADEPEAGVAFGNWNDSRRYDPETRESTVTDRTPSRVARLLERLGVECEWEDEWTTCAECYRAIRTSPDCYSWTPAYLLANECEPVCEACVESDPEPYLLELEGNARSAWTLDIDPEAHGYVRAEDGFETGFHPGQNDDPADVAERLADAGVSRYVFRLDSTGQFDATWSVYVHEDEAPALAT